MTGIDQFESAFRATLRATFEWQPLSFARILVVTDELAGPEARPALLETARALCPSPKQLDLRLLAPDESIAGLLESIAQLQPDLVLTHRGLASPSWRQPYTLGENLEVLTQIAAPPVLALPHPKLKPPPKTPPKTVLALSASLSGSNALVNAALAVTPMDGRLALAHVEDAPSFERFLEVISKLPSIDTEQAREEIASRLLKEPTDFAAAVRATLQSKRPDQQVSAHITRGAHTRDYLAVVKSTGAELVVMETRDDDQLAMHGMAHTLAIELRTTPLLLL